MSREIRHKGNPPSRKATAGKQAQRHKVIADCPLRQSDSAASRFQSAAGRMEKEVNR